MSIAFNETVASDELDLESDVENTPEGKRSTLNRVQGNVIWYDFASICLQSKSYNASISISGKTSQFASAARSS
jgi:hypothetical protein